MYMYHINVGYPVLDKGSRYVAPIQECVWAGHGIDEQGVGYRTQPDPRDNFAEQVYEHRICADENGKVPVALINDGLAGGLGLAVEYDRDQLPCLLQWQSYQKGLYTMGIEPGTNHVLGKEFARENSRLIWLEHGDQRRYEVKFEVLAGEEEITQFDNRVQGITDQLADEFVTPTANWHLNSEEIEQ